MITTKPRPIDLYKVFMEKINVGFFCETPDGVIMEANDALVRIMGGEERLLAVGMNVIDFYVNPEERSHLIEELLARGEVKDRVILMRRVGLRPFWARINAVAHKRDDGLLEWICGTLEDVSESKELEESLKRREAILEAIASSAEEVLKGMPPSQLFPRLLERLGRAADVSRVYIFDREDKGEEILVSQRYEWVAEGITPQIDNPELQNFPMFESGFGRWLEAFSHGGMILGDIKAFPPTERLILEDQQIKSILVIPLMAKGDWIGFLGFDECRWERNWMAAEINALKSAAGLISTVIQRREVEGELKREREKILEVLENAPYGIIIADEKGKHLFVNREFTKITGYTLKDVPTVRDWLRKAFPDPEMRKKAKRRWRPGVARRGEEVTLELMTKDGERRVASFRASLLPDNEVIIVFADITARCEMEAELRKKEEYYRIILEKANDGITYIDKEARLLYVNPRMKEILKDDHPEGKFLYEFYDEKNAAILRKHLSRRWKGETTTYEITLTDREGHPHSMLVSGAPYTDDEGNVLGAIGIYRDVTEEKKREEQLRLAQRMEAVGELAGGIAHDFNNLLTTILSCVEMAKLNLLPDHPVQRYLEMVEKEARRASSLTRQLLAYARRQVLEMKPLKLNKVIEEVMGILERTLGEHIHIKVSIDPDIGIIKADPSALEQILMNLCLNARDAMPQGGELLIETRNVTVTEEERETRPWAKPGDYVLLSVHDTGCGMNEETQRRIFEPFFTTKEGGTGLGLSVVYGLVKQHDGMIDVWSEVGKGTHFSVYFPIVRGAEVEEVSRGKEGVVVLEGKGTILVVEDEEEVRKVIKEILEEKGYQVLMTGDGEEALHLLKERAGEVDLVLADLVMPRMGGKDLYEKAKKRYPRIPFLFMSGYSPEAHRDFITQAGTEYIQKPFSPTDLLRKVRQILFSGD